MQSFYQDRLGTNIGKTQKRQRFAYSEYNNANRMVETGQVALAGETRQPVFNAPAA